VDRIEGIIAMHIDQCFSKWAESPLSGRFRWGSRR